MKNEKFDQIIDEVYKHYQETHEYEPLILADEMGLTKEDFVKKATNNYGFGFLFGITLNERELSFEEKVHEARKRFGFELEDGTRTFDINTSESIKFLQSTQRVITLFYKGEEIEIYE